MDIDTSLTQPTTTVAEEGQGNMATTTISPDSSNSVSSTSGSPKSATDRQQQQQSDTNSNDNSSEHTSDNSGQINIFVEDEACSKSRRGGLLTYSSCATTADEEAYWDFVQPLVTVNEPVADGNGTKQEYISWMHKIRQWRIESLEKQQKADLQREEELELMSQQPRRRGRRKRRKEPNTVTLELEAQENMLEWYESNVDGQRSQKRTKRDGVQEAEDKAHALQQLWLRHRGAGAVAKIDAMVQLSSGKGKISCYKVGFYVNGLLTAGSAPQLSLLIELAITSAEKPHQLQLLVAP